MASKSTLELQSQQVHVNMDVQDGFVTCEELQFTATLNYLAPKSEHIGKSDLVLTRPYNLAEYEAKQAGTPSKKTHLAPSRLSTVLASKGLTTAGTSLDTPRADADPNPKPATAQKIDKPMRTRLQHMLA